VEDEFVALDCDGVFDAGEATVGDGECAGRECVVAKGVSFGLLTVFAP
jgi:hypothetical protein